MTKPKGIRFSEEHDQKISEHADKKVWSFGRVVTDMLNFAIKKGYFKKEKR